MTDTVGVAVCPLQVLSEPGGHEDAAEVHQGDVDVQQSRFLAAVLGPTRSEGCIRLIGKLAFEEQGGQRVDELPELPGLGAVPGRGPEHYGIRPLNIIGTRDWNMLTGRYIGGPYRV